MDLGHLVRDVVREDCILARLQNQVGSAVGVELDAVWKARLLGSVARLDYRNQVGPVRFQLPVADHTHSHIQCLAELH